MAKSGHLGIKTTTVLPRVNLQITGKLYTFIRQSWYHWL